MWALKRKLIIYLFFLLILLVILFGVYIKYIKKQPTCFDGIKNGLEEGVDCGGSCEEVCRLKAERVNVIWSKTFEVFSGISNIAALVENPNFDYKMTAVYNIKTFDNEGFKINDIDGRIELEPAEKRIIFIPTIKTGGAKITKTFIDFTNIESLTKGIREKKELIVSSKVILEEDNQTRLSVGIKNIGLIPKKNIEVIATLSDGDGNVVDVAKTFLEYIGKREEKKVNVTWQKIFSKKDLRIDVFLREINF